MSWLRYEIKNLVQLSPVYCFRDLSFKAINELQDHSVRQKQSNIHLVLIKYEVVLAAAAATNVVKRSMVHVFTKDKRTKISTTFKN